MIEITNLSKTYGTKTILHNLNLTFNTGKTIGIVGENGSGKTTLFKCITGIEKFYGEINSIRKPIKDHIGYLPTEPYYFSKITGREYIQLLCNARSKSMPDLDKKNIFDLPLDQYASTYSTGMKKKLGLMGILFQENEYFIFDEPFNGVDIQSNIIITEILKELKSLNKTIIISSHIFSTLTDICDEMHLLKNGAINRSVTKEGYDALEQEMKDLFIGNQVRDLGIK